MQFKKIAFLLISITLFITGCGDKEEEKEKLEAIKSKNIILQTNTTQTLNFEKKDDGKIIIKELQGKVVLLNFWAVWCPPCKVEIPHLINLKKKYQEKFEIVAIEMGKRNGTHLSKEEINAFIAEYNIDYPVTIGENNYKIADEMGGVSIIPTMFMIDGEGNIVQKYVGVVPEEMMETDIKRALGK